MRFRLKNKEGSTLKFRLSTRDDDNFTFILNEKFKGSIVHQVMATLDRESLVALYSRISLFLYDVDNPRNADTTPEEHTRIRKDRDELCSKLIYVTTQDE